MDLRKELEEINSKGVNPRILISEMIAQKEELDNKIHTLNVIAFIKEIKELYDEGLFDKASINAISIFQEYDYDNKSTYYIIDFLDEQSKTIAGQLNEDQNYSGNFGRYIEPFKTIKTLKTLFSTLYGNGKGFINENFTEGDRTSIKIEYGFQEKLLDLFLCTELKLSLNHSEMQNAISEDNNSVIKKPKL